MWLRVATWIEIDNEKRSDEDGTLDPELGHDLQVGLVSVDGVEKCDGMALFEESDTNVAPTNGGNWDAR